MVALFLSRSVQVTRSHWRLRWTWQRGTSSHPVPRGGGESKGTPWEIRLQLLPQWENFTGPFHTRLSSNQVSTAGFVSLWEPGLMVAFMFWWDPVCSSLLMVLMAMLSDEQQMQLAQPPCLSQQSPPGTLLGISCWALTVPKGLMGRRELKHLNPFAPQCQKDLKKLGRKSHRCLLSSDTSVQTQLKRSRWMQWQYPLYVIFTF